MKKALMIVLLTILVTESIHAQLVLRESDTNVSYWFDEPTIVEHFARYYDDNFDSGITEVLSVSCETHRFEGYRNKPSYVSIRAIELGGNIHPTIDDEVQFKFSNGTVTKQIENPSFTAWYFYVFDREAPVEVSANTLYDRDLFEDILEEFIEHGELEVVVTSLEDDEEYELSLAAFTEPHITGNVGQVVSSCYHARKNKSGFSDRVNSPDNSASFLELYENVKVMEQRFDKLVQDVELLKHSEDPNTLELLKKLRDLLDE